jgi:signal transduction histidine kinase
MSVPDTAAAATGIRAEGVARTVRHEVGDLLQALYATVALLQGRLPDSLGEEKRLLVNLRARAELCRLALDAVVDLVSPPTPNPGPVDLSGLARELVRENLARRPVRIDLAEGGPSLVHADAARLRSAGRLLLENAIDSAARQVQVDVSATPEEVVWSFTDDGSVPSSEQLEWLSVPFARTRRCMIGLGLALARQVAEAHGGRVDVTAPAEGGSRVRIHLPAPPPDGDPGKG